MPYDPAFPATDAYLISSEFRSQFTGIVNLIQSIPVGPTGPAGVNAAVIDGVITASPGDNAAATATFNAGTLHFSFSIPRGDVGAQGTTGLTGATGADGGVGATGATGAVGPAFTSFVVDSVTTLDPAQPATVTAVFDGTNVKLSFGIPRGLQGNPGNDGGTGATGATGAIGPAFTSFVIDSVTTLDPVSPASVTATFDGTNVKLAFGIPRGFPGSDGGIGATGPQGAPGEVSMAEFNTAIANTSSNSNSVAGLAGPYADPDAETLRQKLNELIVALRK
jgi:hypothetical protein